MKSLRVKVSAPPLEVSGAIRIKGIARVEILEINKDQVKVRHTIYGGGEPDIIWLRVGDAVASNVDLEMLGY